MTNGNLPLWLGRLLRLLPLVFALLCWTGCAAINSEYRQAVSHAQPLPAYRRLVVLIVPGLDASDWADAPTGQTANPLENVVWSCPSAIAPVPATLRSASTDAADPNARLQKACQLLLDKNGALAKQAKAGKSSIVLLDDASQTLAQTVGGSAKSVPDTWHVPDPSAAGGLSTDGPRFASAVRAVLAGANKSPSASPVLAVALLDDVNAADTYAPLCLPAAARKLRQAAVARAARAFYALTYHEHDEPTPDAVLLISLFASAHQDGPAENERIGLLVLWNRRREYKYAPILLTSPSTRRVSGLATFDAVFPTLAAFLNPTAINARSSRALALVPNGIGTINHQLAFWTNQWRELRFLVVVPWVLAGLLIAAVWAQAKSKPGFAGCALFAAALPSALWLATIAPFASAGVSGNGVAFYANAALLASFVALAGVWRPRAFPWLLQAICVVSVLLAALNTVSAGPLFMRSPLSFSVLEGARFYGVGNEAAGVFLGASLVWAALLPPGRAHFAARLLTSLGVACAIGSPTAGANTGGAVAALAGGAALIVLSVSKPRRKLALVCAGLCALLLLSGLVLWESRRPASEQTHLGQVVAQTQAGNKAEGAVAIARRKIAVNARLLVTSPWAVLLATETGLCIYLWRKAKKTRGFPDAARSGAIALFVGALAAFVANDSGVVMASTVLLFGPPFLLAANEIALKE